MEPTDSTATPWCPFVWKAVQTDTLPSPIRTKMEKLSTGRQYALPSAGHAGDDVPYRFSADSLVTSLIMFSLLCMMWVVARSRGYIRRQLSDFFRRGRSNLFAQRTENEMSGQLLLILQICFMLSVLFFDFAQECLPEVFRTVSPYKLLGAATGICLVYYALKFLLYALVNNVFFESEQVQQWNRAHVVCVWAWGAALIPVTLLVVYLDLNFSVTCIMLAVILVIVKLMLIFKSFRTFFGYPFGWVHLFLYFCTLEAVPLLVVFETLLVASRRMQAFN